MWDLSPVPGVHGSDLTPEEKLRLGLGPARLAFRQGKFVTAAARRAGVLSGDIIIGIDGKALELTVLQFNAYVRLNYQVGDRVTLDVLRDGKPLKLTLTLAEKSY
jgi:S1-C subfamily serine protease